MTNFEIPYISKKPNPNAGRTYYEIPMGPTINYVDVESPLEEFDNRLAGYNNGIYSYVFYLSKEFEKALKYMEENPSKFKKVRITTKADTQRVHSLSPEGSHLYRYDESFEVQCEYCKEKFSWKELKYDEVYDYDLGSYTETKCPKCNEWDCCSITFQK